MAINNDSPISGLPGQQRAPAANDLLIISQLLSPGVYFTAKLTIASLYAYFTSNLQVSNIQLLQGIIDNIYAQLDTKVSGNHTHVISEITGLQTILDGKAPSTHAHVISQVTGLQAALDEKALTSHTHTVAQVTGLQLALNQKAESNHIHDMVSITGLIDALSSKLNSTLKGQPNGLAELGVDGLVKATQLPSYIIEAESADLFPEEGQVGRIYIDLETGVSYRWNGLAYSPLNSGLDSLQLGEDAASAYRGDRGKIAYDHSQSDHAPLDAQKNVQADWEASDGDAYILNKPETFPPTSHQHDYNDITGEKPPIDAQRNVQSNWDATEGDEAILNKPAEFPPTAHQHDYSQITGDKPPVDAQRNVQVDWTATEGDAYILNRPDRFPAELHQHDYNDITGDKPPIDAQKNSDITQEEIESKLQGEIASHTHAPHALTKEEVEEVLVGEISTHSHPVQELTKLDIENKLTGEISSHSHAPQVLTKAQIEEKLTGVILSHTHPETGVSAEDVFELTLPSFDTTGVSGKVNVSDNLLMVLLKLQAQLDILGSHDHGDITDIGGEGYYPFDVTDGTLYTTSQTITLQPGYYRIAAAGVSNTTADGHTSVIRALTGDVLLKATRDTSLPTGSQLYSYAMPITEPYTQAGRKGWLDSQSTYAETLTYLFTQAPDISKGADGLTEAYNGSYSGSVAISNIIHIVEATDLTLTIGVHGDSASYDMATAGTGFVWIREILPTDPEVPVDPEEPEEPPAEDPPVEDPPSGD